MERLPIPIPQERGRSFEQFEQEANSAVTSSEATDAASELAWDETGVGLLARSRAMKELNQGKKMTPEEANAQFPEMDQPFREPVTAYQAQFLAGRAEEKRKLQEKLMNGPSDTWSQTKQFGAGIVAHLMDPIEFGASSIVGWGVGGLVARGAIGTRAAAAAKAVSSGSANLGTRVGANLIESGVGNIVENVAQEGFVANQVTDEGGVYDTDAGVDNLIVGTVAGTLFGGGVKELGHLTGNTLKRFLRGTSPEADLMVARTAVGQLEQDIRPNVEPILKSLALETNVVAADHPGKFSYNYEPALKGGKEMYVVVHGELGSGDRVSVGDGYTGRTITDHPGVANAAAARALNDSNAKIVKVDAADLNSLHLNEKLPDDVRPGFESIIGRVVPPEILQNGTGKQILDAVQQAVDDGDLRPAIFNRLQENLEAKGYDSWVHDGSSHMGEAHGQHNVVEIFNEDAKLTAKGHYEPDPTVRADPTPETKASAESYGQGIKNRIDLDHDDYMKFKEEVDADMAKVTTAADEADAHIETMIDEMDNLEKQGLLDESFKTEFENLKTLKAEAEFNETLTKAVAFCVGG